MVGGTLLARIRYLNPDDTVASVLEIAGVVTEVDPLVTIALAGREPFTLPPDPEAFEAAEPGQYRLRTTGEVVTDPDFLTIWTVHLARPSHGG